jgi:hypothetical protein
VGLQHIALCSLSEDVNSWLRFAHRYGRSIKSLEVGATHLVTRKNAIAVAASLRTQFPSLEAFRVIVGAERCLKLACLLFSEMSSLPTIKALRWSGMTNEPQAMVRVFYGIMRVASHCARLETLQVHFSVAEHGRPLVDGRFVLLTRLLHSKSLEELDLAGISFLNAEPGQALHSTNRSVKKIRLEKCLLGEDCLSLISSLTGVKSIEFRDVNLETYPAVMTTSIFERLHNLASFSNWKVNSNDHLLWIASTLRGAPFPLGVTLECSPVRLPSLRDVIARGRAEHSLELHLTCGDHRDDNLRFLCEGIGFSQGVTNLELVLRDVRHQSVASILNAVQGNSFFRRFVGRFHARRIAVRVADDDGRTIEAGTGRHIVDLAVDDVCRALEELLANNTTLDYLGFDLVHDAVQPRAVAYAARGLRDNRRLLTLNLESADNNGIHCPSPRQVLVDASISEEIVAMLEERNTTLLRIEGLAYESRQHQERIEYLLELNRRGPSFASNAHQVPLEQWGDLLCRISNADCNYLVIKLARQALRRSRPRG